MFCLLPVSQQKSRICDFFIQRLPLRIAIRHRRHPHKGGASPKIVAFRRATTFSTLCVSRYPIVHLTPYSLKSRDCKVGLGELTRGRVVGSRNERLKKDRLKPRTWVPDWKVGTCHAVLADQKRDGLFGLWRGQPLDDNTTRVPWHCRSGGSTESTTISTH
jgi:hypothetical protein